MNVIVSVCSGLLDELFCHFAVLRDLLFEFFDWKARIDQRCCVEAVFSYLCSGISENILDLSLHARSCINEHVTLLLKVLFQCIDISVLRTRGEVRDCLIKFVIKDIKICRELRSKSLLSNIRIQCVDELCVTGTLQKLVSELRIALALFQTIQIGLGIKER